MSIRQLHTLVAIADGGSFRAAAERLNMTQSAVSMQMKTLEDALRVELFDRTKRPSVLNSTGWQMVEEARSIVEHYGRLFSISSSPPSELAGMLHIGVIPSIACYLLPNALSKLQKHHQDLHIQVKTGLSPQLTALVEEKQLDVAVITEADSLGATFAVEPLGEEELKAVVHRDLAGCSIREMLKSFPFIRFNPALGVGRIIEATLRARDMSVNDVLEVDSIETMIGIVKLKLGVTIIPVQVASSDLTSQLISISFDPPATRRISLVTRREMTDAPAVKAVANTFKALLTTRVLG